MNPTSVAGSNERFTFVDALRGVASLSVFLCHFLLLVCGLKRNGRLFDWSLALSFGFALGVQIFFVLSGFVIAHSLRNNDLSLRSVGRFMLRRQIRLDPSYWLVLFATILFGLLLPRLVAQAHPKTPDLRQVFLNAFYVQNIFHSDSLIAVAWTLCLEVQFYVFFLLCLFAGKALSQKASSPQNAVSSPTLFLIFGSGALSILVALSGRGLFQFPTFWFFFVSGVLACWAFHGAISSRYFLLFQTLVLSAIAWMLWKRVPLYDVFAHNKTTPPALFVGMMTALLLWHAARRGKLANWGRNRVLQYFGRVSYSLYLVHVLVLTGFGWLGAVVLSRPFGTSSRIGVFLMILAASVVCSFVAAHALYIAVERPSLRWSARFKNRAENASLQTEIIEQTEETLAAAQT